ncbi:MAG: hypothetical protein LBQ96_04240 [Fusobacteriaceae bacterium]|jgi:hypothetical protein|nr:hypothetical protein [Fusobacteriaceae bacterium]
MVPNTKKEGRLRKFSFISPVLVCLLLPALLFSASSLEKRIKKLELEVIEFERKTAGIRKTKKKPAAVRDTPAGKIGGKPKEIHMEIPEYDPATKNIAVKNKEVAPVGEDPAEDLGMTVEQSLDLAASTKLALPSADDGKTIPEEIKIVEDGTLVALTSSDKTMADSRIITDGSAVAIQSLVEIPVPVQILPEEKDILFKVESLDVVNKVENSI